MGPGNERMRKEQGNSRQKDELERQKPEEDFIFTVLLPDTIPRRWWERFLYCENSLLLKGKLLVRPRTAVIVVPYDLKK